MEPHVDIQLEQRRSGTTASIAGKDGRSLERSIMGYWAISLVAGVVLLGDWLSAWNVPATLASPGLVVYLLITFAIGQYLYVLVARHDGRPLRWAPTLIFALGNGIFETMAFAAMYRLGELLGAGLVGSWFPAAASTAGFVLGVIFFIIYGGLIHAIYWLRVLPPHLDEGRRARAIRRLRPIFEVALALGWSLCFWLNRDIWTVVMLHVLVDLGLMLRVRPAIFGWGG